jgi:cytosine/adenosine deaminase-related metal-dependent hydrolase
LGDGIFPAEAYLRSGGTFGIGTDSNIVIDAGGDLRALEYSQRLSLRARGRLAGIGQISVGRTLFDGALKGGARALETTGDLKIGTPANIISLNKDHPALWERKEDQILDSWIFSANSNPIDRVYARGALVVKDGAAIGFDTIKHKYRKVLAKIRA